MLGHPLPIIDAHAADVPHALVPVLASNPLVRRLTLDRLVVGALDRTGPTVGAASVRQSGYNGSGVGVAVIDSGITSWHNDLTDSRGTAQRVDQFVDFVNGRLTPYDDHGHGTHVAGILAGNGFRLRRESIGHRTGRAPDRTSKGTRQGLERNSISDVIAALGYVVAHRDTLDIGVVNLSVATGVYESYNLNPLTLAAQHAVNAGIVVVAAAGNNQPRPAGLRALPRDRAPATHHG